MDKKNLNKITSYYIVIYMKVHLKKMVGLGIALLFVIVTISYPGAADAQYGQVSGTTSYVDGWGVYILPFTRVSTVGLSDISNVFGEYCIDNVPLGTRTVTASKTGFESASFDVELTESHPFAQIHFVLEEDEEGDGCSSYVVKSVQSINNVNVVCYEVHLQKVTT